MLNKIKKKRYIGIIDSLLEDYIEKYQSKRDNLLELKEDTHQWIIGANIASQLDEVNKLSEKVKFLGEIRDELENNTFTKEIEVRILDCI